MRTFFILLALAAVASTLAIQKQEKSLVQPQKLALLDGILCDVCKDLITGAENSGEGDMKALLEKQIDSVCPHLGFFAKECKKILDDLVDQLDDLINQHLEPVTICTKVELCGED